MVRVVQVMQSIGFLGPAFFLTQLSNVHSPVMAVLCMACSQVCMSNFFFYNFDHVSVNFLVVI